VTTTQPGPGGGREGDTTRFSADLLYSAARLYYVEEANQAVIAERLGLSRATVSRMLAEARRRGIVRVEVIAPHLADTDALARRVTELLGLQAVHVTSTVPALRGTSLAAGVAAALRDVGLEPGDVLLLSSGRTVYEITEASTLPHLPGVEVAPMIGGQDEPEPWYQTNEIVRRFAASVGGHPSFLYAPALPGPRLHATLMKDPAINRVLELWGTARCAIVGVGPPPLTRDSIPGFVPTGSLALHDAVGDICSRFYDRTGRAIAFPGSDRLISTQLDELRNIPVTIAVAIGEAKLLSIVTGARAGYFRQLVTDLTTATLLVEHLSGEPGAHG